MDWSLILGRLALAVGASCLFFGGWRGSESRDLPRQPIRLRPTQVRAPDVPQTPPPTVSVLAREPEFLENVCPPIRKPVPQKCEILTDLYCRVQNPNYWRDPSDPGDIVTHVHELGHGVSNRLHATTSRHGIYIGYGKGIVLKHPDITIRQVAERVPQGQRGKVFDLYMVQQAKDWNKSPCYIMDEANSYILGCIAHSQLGYGKKRSETFEFAREMQFYSEVMVDTVRRLDPDYSEMDKLKSFVAWQSNRLKSISEKREPK
jgi:hypothetical protein